jgi:hypothetical protein
MVAAGTDTYGRVKKVSGTPVVTKFTMLQFLPLFPLQSFYFTGQGPVERTGIPLLASSQSVHLYGVPLASVDRTSVVIAYARALFAALVTLGMIGAMMGIMALNNPRPPDEFARIMLTVLLGSLVIGVLGGILTYVIPLTPRRERAIRQHCAVLLGVSADPARVPAKLSAALIQYAAEKSEDDTNPATTLVFELIQTRANIAQGTDKDVMEAKTDELLESLRIQAMS